MSASLTFSDRWEFYPCTMNDAPYSVRYDTSVGKQPEEILARYPHTLVLRIPFLEARENGFPTQNEMQRINAIEDSLQPDEDRLRLLGVLTGQGSSRFVFCCHREAADWEKTARRLLGGAGELEFALQTFEDDHLGYYDQVLLPSRYERGWMMDRKVCENLQQNGEAFQKPRPIDFYLYFGNEQDLEAVYQALSPQGFALAGREQKEDGQYLLYLTLEEIPELSRINQITSGILDVMEERDGYLDGWGCPVHREGE